MPQSKRILTLFAVVLSMGLATTSFAAYMDHEDIVHRWGVGIQTAAAVPTASEANPGYIAGGHVTYGLLDHLAVQVEFGYHEMSYEGFGIEFGQLQGVPLIVSFQMRFPHLLGQTKATAYALLGAGKMFYEFDNEADPRARAVDVDDPVIWKLGAGYDVFLDDHWVLNRETSYVFAGEDVDLVTADGSQQSTENSDFWQLGGGLQYFF